MSDKPQIKNTKTTETSKLEQFTLGFEYDKMLPEIKREVRLRTDRKR